jgi:hypothetical protein
MDPLGYSKVTVFNAVTGVALRSATTDDVGNYVIGGLPAISIKVRATKAGYLDAWAGGTSKSDADVYALVAGQTLRQSWGDPPVLYLDLAPESVVTGTVMGFNDWTEHPYDDPLGDVRVTVISATTGETLRSALTDRAGNFRIGMLQVGQVKVRATKAGWLTTWATNKSTRTTADVFTIRPFTPTDLGTLAMYAPAAVQGQVLTQMDPRVGEVRVTVFNADNGTVLGSVVSDSMGNFRVDQLPPGSIKLRATKPGYLTTWANSNASPGPMTYENATVFTLVAGQVLTQSWQTPPFGPYLDLMPEAVVTGSVWSVPFGTHSDPVAGATVTVFQANTGKVIGRAITNSQGDYRVGMLPWGDLKIRLSKAGWVTTWAVGKSSMATADIFSLYPGQTLQQSWNWDFTPLNYDPCDYRPCPLS